MAIKNIASKILLFLMVALFACTEKQAQSYDAISYVDPQIGSVHGRWFFYTPACLPFGMVKLAPHTNAYEGLGSWDPQGYDDRHTSIEGFGHFHEFQVGGLVIMPTVGVLQTIPGTLDNPDEGYRSRFDKESENAKPGFYEVLLKDYNIGVELTATKRVGYHRYTFPHDSLANIIFDVGHKQGESSDLVHSEVFWDGEKVVSGSIETYPEYAKFCDENNHVEMYFVAQLSKTPQKAGSFIDTQLAEGETSSKGIKNGMYFTFETEENEVVEIRVGVSYTSIENARLNLLKESTGIDFDEAKKLASEEWNSMLSTIKVKGSNTDDKIKFYTGLYHALLGRGVSSDCNGQYPKNDGSIGQIPLDADGVPTHFHYNTDGLWGGYWNLTQLWGMAYPGQLSNYVQSNIDFYKETGWLHDGEAAGVFTNGVQTNFQALVLASAYNCGIRDFDIETGYEAALKNEVEASGRNLGNGKYDMHWFKKLNYVPFVDTTLSNGWVFNFGGSHTLEYSFGSYAVAQMAMDLGYDEDYKQLMRQANYWKNLFDKETNFIRPKYPDGKFIDGFDPMKPWHGFQEGNAFQFTWFVPHDIQGLIDAMGLELFNQRLGNQFEEVFSNGFGGGDDLHSFSGVSEKYNHGNQPCLHQSWLFNYSGIPWLTQRATRKICDDFYGVEALHGYGYGQDEDQGQLGAWYVLNAMGLFDVQGHANREPTFQFSAPIFDEVSIDLDEQYYEGKALTIKANNNSKENVYIQSLSFNGQEVKECWMKRSELMKGGTLIFEMGSTPNKEWGIETPPPSMEEL